MVEGSIYVGESSRTLYERSREHEKDWKDRKEKSHVAKHQGAVHGLEEEPRLVGTGEVCSLQFLLGNNSS